MDEVARRLALTWHVRLEISIDAVIQFAIEGLLEQPFETLQAVRIVRQTEFTVENKQRSRKCYDSSVRCKP